MKLTKRVAALLLTVMLLLTAIPLGTFAEGETVEGDGTNTTAAVQVKPVADTYVSVANPDTAYGTANTLLLGDADGDKKLMVLSFKSAVLEINNSLLLKLSNGGAALEDVSVYWIADYCLEEDTLTYNELEKLNYKDNLLGTYDLVNGTNKLDLSSIRDKLTAGDYFTLVFRTEGHSFAQDFEGYEASTTTTTAPTANDETEGDVTYYYGYTTGTEKKDIARVAGGFASYQVNQGSSTKYLRVHTTKGATTDALVKFYNSMSYSVLTAADVGKTYRFTARVMRPTSNAGGKDVFACVTWSDGSTTIIKQGDAVTLSAQSKWYDVTIDYTIREEDIAPKMDESGNTYYAYPMFAISFPYVDGKAGHYAVDTLSVVEIGDDATFASREDTDATAPIQFVNDLDGKITVMETMVSSATTGAVFSIVDGDTTHTLLSVNESKNLTYTSAKGTAYTLCNYQGEAYVLGEDSVKVVAIYNDSSSRVRFVVGDALACYRKGQVTDNESPQPFTGGVGENAYIMGVGDITATWLKQEVPELIGFQYSLVDNTSVRFLAGIDSLYYTEIGFKVAREDYETQEAPSSYVFTSVNVGGDEPVSATDLGYEYMAALIIEDITSDGVITVTPYVKMDMDEEGIVGTSATYTITVTDDVVSIAKSTASAE